MIASNQYAYRPKVGSTDALLQLLDDCTAELDLIESKYVQLACLDFSKAFDKLQPQILLKKLQKCNINGNLIDILEDFLKRRQQCVKVNDSFSDFIDISVGAPQGTKLGPILWLFYINDLEVDNFSMVKYADDTSFYTTIRNPQTESIAPAVIATESWSDRNFMSLNADKTEIMNILNNHRNTFDQEVIINGISIQPKRCVAFLGVLVDDHLSFSDHVDKLISDCDKRLYLLRQLKILGMNQQGLTRFFCSNVRSLISYAAPAWFPLLSDTDKIRLEKIQRTATRAIIPDMEYEERLCILQLPYLSDFLMDLSERHFNKIACDSSHPLFDRIIFNNNRMSSRLRTIYNPKRSRSQKRAKSFFPFFMSKLNN